MVPLEYVGGEWHNNSAIVPVDVIASVENREIDVTVVTSAATNSNDTDGDRLLLPMDVRGTYEVFYRDPDGTRHEIGELEIND